MRWGPGGFKRQDRGGDESTRAGLPIGGVSAIITGMSQHVQPSKVPQERDFTGGMISGISLPYVGSTGQKALDDKIMALAREIEDVSDPSLLAEMIIVYSIPAAVLLPLL